MELSSFQSSAKLLSALYYLDATYKFTTMYDQVSYKSGCIKNKNTIFGSTTISKNTIFGNYPIKDMYQEWEDARDNPNDETYLGGFRLVLYVVRHLVRLRDCGQHNVLKQGLQWGFFKRAFE